MRNIENQVKQGEEIISKHSKADMRQSELEKLLEPIRKEPTMARVYDAISEAFYMGVAVGSRCRG